jgi:hypothetical protein
MQGPGLTSSRLDTEIRGDRPLNLGPPQMRLDSFTPQE